jgi:hypothetical protein
MAALALELQAFGCGVVKGAGRLSKPRDGSPRAPSPRLSLEKAAPDPTRERLRRSAGAKAQEAIGCPFDGQGSGVVFPGRDQARDQPQSRFLLDAQREATTAENAGHQPQGVDQRALNFSTGRLHWVRGDRKNDELFMELLDQLRRTYRCHRQLHLATDNDSSHTSKNGSSDTWRIRADASVCTHCLHGLLRAIRWNWCGGLCMRL